MSEGRHQTRSYGARALQEKAACLEERGNSSQKFLQLGSDRASMDCSSRLRTKSTRTGPDEVGLASAEQPLERTRACRRHGFEVVFHDGRKELHQLSAITSEVISEHSKHLIPRREGKVGSTAVSQYRLGKLVEQ